MDPKPSNAFEQAARTQTGNSLLGELWQFLRCNKKWWLLPIVLVLLMFGLLMLLGSGAAAPFIYTLF